MITAEEQPGSASGFAVFAPGHGPESEDFRGSGQTAGCSFGAFNSEISERGTELHIGLRRVLPDSADE